MPTLIVGAVAVAATILSFTSEAGLLLAIPVAVIGGAITLATYCHGQDVKFDYDDSVG